MFKDTIRKCAADLEVALTGVNLEQEKGQIKTTIEGYMLCEEMKALKQILSPEIQNPAKLLEFLAWMTCLLHFQICVLLFGFFFYTIPLTGASGERSFSLLKLMKTYLRSRIQQEHLNSPAFMSNVHWIWNQQEFKRQYPKRLCREKKQEN